MRIAVFSDIHGNCVGLDAMLADARNQHIHQYVCLGDALQGGPQPAEVISRLRELGCPVVMGNADAWMLTGQETGAENISPERKVRMDAIREWSLSQLSSADREFIAAFHPTVEIDLGANRKLLCFHGSPTSFDDIMLPDSPQDLFLKNLGGFDALAFTGGHTHVQYVRRLDAGPRIYFNPGSVGFAYSHHQTDENRFHADPWAEYAILSFESGKLSLEFRRIPIDIDQLIAVYKTSGRPFAEQAVAEYED